MKILKLNYQKNIVKKSLSFENINKFELNLESKHDSSEKFIMRFSEFCLRKKQKELENRKNKNKLKENFSTSDIKNQNNREFKEEMKNEEEKEEKKLLNRNKINIPNLVDNFENIQNDIDYSYEIPLFPAKSNSPHQIKKSMWNLKNSTFPSRKSINDHLLFDQSFESVKNFFNYMPHNNIETILNKKYSENYKKSFSKASIKFKISNAFNKYRNIMKILKNLRNKKKG